MPKLNRIQPRVKTVNTDKVNFFHADRITGRPLRRSRQRIAQRDGYQCRVCGRLSVIFEVDHIVPISVGGSDDDDNKQLLCVECHAIKTRSEAAERGS